MKWCHMTEQQFSALHDVCRHLLLQDSTVGRNKKLIKRNLYIPTSTTSQQPRWWGQMKKWCACLGDEEKWCWMVMTILMAGSFAPLPSLKPGGRLLFLFFLDPNNLTRENTFSLLGFSLAPLLLLGLLLPRQAFAFSRSLACRFWRIRELAIAAARDMLLNPAAWSEAVRPGWKKCSRTSR